jgi:cytochrome c biogenesis protein CcmG, thiol:disulfide interchange protein DsbE
MQMNRKVLLAGLVLVLPLVALLLIGLGRDPHVVRSPLVGRAAPSFTLRPLGGGTPISLESLKGRVVVLNFWASWCIPCAEEHRALVEGARAWGERAQFLGIVYQDDEESARSFLSRHGSAYPSLFDEGGKAAIAYGVYGVPETFFISPEGMVVRKFMGPETPTSLTAHLQEALGGTQVGEVR